MLPPIDPPPGTSPREADAVKHDEAMKWAEVEFEEVPLGFTVKIEGDTLVARGQCPRCHGKTAWSFRRGMMGSVSADMTAMTALSPADLATIVCACGSVHADRPDDSAESGCGAFWPVNLKMR
jgi:hypothetical protein